MYTIARTTLRELTPDSNNALIVGIIIAKQRFRKINTSKFAENGASAVWNFTFRDSRYDYINVAYWGSEAHVLQISERFHKGDIVEIVKPRIEIRSNNGYGEQFRPMVTSPYSLYLQEIVSQILNHFGPADTFLPLLHYPTKPLVCAIRLADLLNNGPNAQGFVDILCSVRKIGEIRSVTTRLGDVLKVRDMFVFDQSCPGMKISLWDPDMIMQAETWIPRATILFLTDVRIQYSEFNKSVVGTLSTRTIVTEDPVGQEVAILKQYAATAPLQMMAMIDQIISSIPDVSTVKTIMNIKQVFNKVATLYNNPALPGDDQFTALLYAIVTNFDLDGCFRTTISECTQCNSLVMTTCPNPLCLPTSNPNQALKIKFDLRLTISDQTGTLENCRLSGKIAEDVLQCSAEKFIALSDQEKSRMKWQFLLNRCVVRILVLCRYKRKPTITIMSCERADPIEVANKLPHY